MNSVHKMEKTAKIIDKILKIIQVVLIVFAIILAGLLILARLDIPGVIAVETKSLVFNESVEVNLQDSYASVNHLGASDIMDVITTYFLMFSGWYVIRIIRWILEPMESGRPFDEGSSHSMFKLAWVSLIAGGVYEVLNTVSDYLNYRWIQSVPLFNQQVVSSVDFDFSFDVTFLIVSIILFLLSFIFRYGETLQRESDETL